MWGSDELCEFRPGLDAHDFIDVYELYSFILRSSSLLVKGVKGVKTKRRMNT